MGKYHFIRGYVYILRCRDGSYHTGSTQDLMRRLWQHQSGIGANYTALRLDRIDTAFKREKQLQGWSRKKKEALMRGDDNSLSFYAACRNSTHYSTRELR